MTVITMSCNELTRLRVLIDVADGRLSVEDATGLIDVGRRQIYRLLQAFHADGPDGLISRKRGGPSNRALGAVFRETVLGIVRERYADFGPTLAAEKLSELHGLDLGVRDLAAMDDRRRYLGSPERPAEAHPSTPRSARLLG
jgi:transposase